MEQEEKTVLSLAQLQQIQFLAEILRYGSITLVFQDGVLIQIDAQWRQAAKDRNISFVQAAIEYEKNFSNWADQQIRDYFEKIDGILYNQIHSLEKTGYDKAKDTPEPSHEEYVLPDCCRTEREVGR